jgi:Domain found in Dishevelled, Egl-10, and Pleckstrin (DEP)
MNTPILLALPHDAAHKSARALVMALGLIPEAVKDGPQALAQLQSRLAQPQAVALLDLGSLPGAFKHVLDLAAKLPAEARSRVILFRHEQGPVWPSDQAWVRDLGFAGLFAEVDTAAMLTEGAALPALLAQLVGCPPLSAQKLAQFFAAMLAKPDPLTLRGLIRAQCSRDAESLAQVMSSGVKSVDRSYHLSRFPSCFLGTEAVQWLRGQYRCSAEIATQIGQALLQLGLIHHVVHEHAFENAEFFYRLDATASASQAHLGRLLQELQASEGLKIEDRSYLGKLYPACWVAKDAVSWLSKKLRVPRYEAENLFNRLLSYGLIEHVTKAHRVKDESLFFRFR